ncbi:MAG: hypothetical protein D6711_09850, partial [Chloroflexi bacterium]
MRRNNLIVGVLLGLVMLLGGYFRLMANNWDDFVRFHPDERYLTGQIAPAINGDLAVCFTEDFACQEYMARVNACREKYPDTNGVGGFFDANCSNWNPENVALTQYVYGTLPLFIVRQAAEVVAQVDSDPSWLGYNGLFMVWRVISGVSDILTILLVFFIGRRLHDKWVGLLAAFLYAFAVFPIQQAHFGTTDAMTTLFVTLALYFAARTQDTGAYFDYGCFGLALGAAVASRINVAPLAAIIVVVAVYRAVIAFDTKAAYLRRNAVLWQSFLGVIIAALASMLMFRLGNPYAFEGPGFFGLIPNDRFIDALEQAQFSVSGEMDWAPNWQWVNRIGYLFPLQNMILWGMGIALGLTGWIAFLVSGWRLVRGKLGGTRNLVLFAWVLGYFLFVGNLWVMSMRYYLPLYPPLALMAAWLLMHLWRTATDSSSQMWRMAAGVAVVTVAGFTLLWALMFTNVYRNMATFVQAGHYTWENIPGDFFIRLENTDEDVPLINIALTNGFPPEEPVENWLWEGASRIYPQASVTREFVAPADGVITRVNAYRIAGFDAATNQPDDGERTVRIRILDEAGGAILAQASITSSFPQGEHPLGQAYQFELDTPLTVQFGERYLLEIQVEGGGVVTGGAVMASEQPWDEAVPPNVCTLPLGVTLADNPPPGLLSATECNGRPPWQALVQIFNLDLAMEDIPHKRDRLQTILDQTDYIWINTNRRYDSNSRLPARFPLTIRYYEALFSGELGFELEAVFQETFEFGPLRVSDQYLPIYNAPAWLNEFEPEEAFTVYDHPVVFLFRKTENYSSKNTAAILQGVNLNRPEAVTGGYNDPGIINVLAISSLQADRAPTQLQFTPEMQRMQREGGTWSDRFDTESVVNTNDFAAMVVWWLAVLVFGWAAFPLLFVVFPGLADRGYAFAKFAGMFLVAWGAWVLATMRIPIWSPDGVTLGLGVLIVISGVITWRNRIEMLRYIRANWRLLLGIEIIMLVMFLFFVQIRMGNPDLWHNGYGGEKPMDFAYFNGILRSTIFPPIDPWYAGGYINYYYFGFVIVGVPTLLTGIAPYIAYNLIIPTWFALTGIAAFSLAFSLVSSWRDVQVDQRADGWADDQTPDDEPPRTVKPLGNPWVAGIAALLMAVVLGNLGTAQVAVEGIASLGGWVEPSGLSNYLYEEAVQNYTDQNGLPPDEVTTYQLRQLANERAARGRLNDHLTYEFNNTTSLFSGLINGLGKMMQGQQPNIAPNHWFWSPTRTIAEILGKRQSDGAINEMPFFTFLYGDLHAHMIAMPMMIFALMFVFHEVLVAGDDNRRGWSRWGALFLGALTVGMFQATNTWDLPTFMILSVSGLGYAWWLGWREVSRWSLLSLLGRVGGFVVIALAVALPFSMWFASGLTEFTVWQGDKTPLWAYFTIHGLFLFVIVSWLTWETGRWLRSVKVAALRGRGRDVMLGVIFLGSTILAGLVMAVIEYQVALIVLPLVAWIVILFFRPGQSRAMQFALVVTAMALCITLGTEIITLRFDNGRQNTIFKFYIQVWLIFSVVAG